MTTISPKKSLVFYACKSCDYTTSSRKDYDKHMTTRKHKNTTKYNESGIKIPQTIFSCDCGKSYPYRSSLYNHKKKCTYIKEDDTDEHNTAETSIIQNSTDDSDYKNMLLTMINENKELRKQITELIPRVGNNNNNTINNKQRFNINVFLNEQCKDALTMNQFINQIKVTIDDLMVTKNKGITEGVSNIFIKNMNKLSVYERPMHCTDIKRETVYIKNEVVDGVASQWEKDQENTKLKEAISEVSYKQGKNLNLYTAENPDWMDNTNKQDEYMLMVKNCTDDVTDKENKIIRKVCNTVYFNGDKIY